MPSDHPQTPQSPSSYDTTDFPSKPVASPKITHSLPTPAHSINGSMSSSTSELPEAHLEESSNKRKRDLEDHGDREQKKVHIEDSRLSIEDLHLDVGKKYLLCRTPHPVAPVPLGEDLYQRFGLTDLAATVARVHPDGSKNTLRKTYKGHIKKSLALSGNFDSVRKEFAEPDSLWSTVMQPNDVWDSQYAQAAKEMALGLPPLATASLSKAVTFARGVIPKDQWNSSVLGELAPRAIASEPAKPVQNGIKTQSPQTLGVPRTKGESRRPSRFPKRKYDDTSYKGYGEGYIDDDLGESGYSTGDGERTARKRPKKTGQSNSFQGPVARQNSYGPGMVGV